MKLTEVKLPETHGCSRCNEPLQFGIPLPTGTLTSTDNLNLIDGNTAWPLQTEVTARWPDNSIRWLLVHTQIPNGALPDVIALVDDAEAACDQQAVALEEKDDHWLITTADHIHQLDRHNGKLTSAPLTQSDEDVQWTTDPKFFAGQDTAASQVVESVEVTRPAGPVLAQFTVSGYWTSERHPRFQSVINIYQHGGLVKIDYCLHNPHRARHPGGLWDLGDPGSIYFKELSITTTCSAQPSNAILSPEQGLESIQADSAEPLCLYQDSSGGKNWNSHNHVDKDGKVTTRFQRYEITRDDAMAARTGLRAQPILSLTGDRFGCTLAMPKFWQNFPSSIKAHQQSLTLGLFPKESGQHYELQGGERKTQTVYLQFNDEDSALDWTRQPIVPVLPAKTYELGEAFPWFNADAEPDKFDELIKASIEGTNSFFAKREVIDEYGWRNFGDLFADHETLYQPYGEEPLISHYNNQYDAIYGFARQFALTGDTRWYELMDDLARHVTDIDIYHTNEDRAEYNNGLFWHTDHYLSAHTATHRTFSRYNNTSSTPGQTGGGPAEEHCYTTGLKTHFWLTGNTNSKAAVLKMADWMMCLHGHQKGFFPRLLSAKKDFKKFTKKLRGVTVNPYPYPFTRGTGNFLNCLLDAYELTENTQYIEDCDAIIRATFSHHDDIYERQLHDVENAWSYLVFLSSIYHYVRIKKHHNLVDKNHDYAVVSLNRYLGWMLENEKPFLSDPSLLEFPNDTWLAQDIRKSALFFQSGLLPLKNNNEYHNTGITCLNRTIDGLLKSETAHYSRIQTILLQSYGPHSARETIKLSKEMVISDSEPYRKSTSGWLLSAIKKMMIGIIEIKPSKEILWLILRK